MIYSTSFNNERLKGKPRFVATRVFIASTRFKGEMNLTRRLFIYDEGSPHSSDRWFTEWGDTEREVFYDYTYERTQKVPVECGSRTALFDEQRNPKQIRFFYTEKRRVCIDKNSLKSKEITETKEVERTLENSYDGKGRLIRKVEQYSNKESERKPFARTYSTLYEYDEKDRVIKTIEDDYRVILYTYDNDRLISKEWLYIWHVHNLFESGERYEKGYKETYKYDEDGNLVEIHHTTEPDSHYLPFERLVRMKYDSKGTLVRKTVTIEDGLGKTMSRYTYKNNTWCHVQIKHRPKEETIFGYCVSTMDEQGNVICKESRSKAYKYRKKKEDWKLDYDSNNTISLEYTYDKCGNWIKKDYHTKHSNYSVTRDIEYYE